MTSKVAAIIVAAGRGYRAGGEMPKQYREIAGEPVIRPTLAPSWSSAIDAVQPVIHPNDEAISRVTADLAHAAAGFRRGHAAGVGARRS